MQMRRFAAVVLLALVGSSVAAPIGAQREELTPPVVDTPDLLFMHGRWPEPGTREEDRPIKPGEWAREAERIEQLELRYSGASVRRDGGMLTLGLRNGRSLIFMDSTRGCEHQAAPTCIAHVFSDWIAREWYVVAAYEKGYGGWAYLVSYVSGRVWRFEAEPMVSRDQRFAVVPFLSVMHGARVQLVRFDNGSLAIDNADIAEECLSRRGDASPLKLYESGRRPMRTAANRIDFLQGDVNGPDAGPGSVHMLRRDGKWRMICEP